MKVQLKVLTGSSSGKSVTVPASGLVIGRGEDCHLRPNSEAVSRQHCRVAVVSGVVVAHDMGSRNGTLVNGEQIDSERPLRAGDILAVGPLEFEVSITQTPQATAVKDPSRIGSSSSVWGEDDIGQWLDEAAPDADSDVNERAVSETRQFKFDDTEHLVVKAPETEATAADPADSEPDPKAKTHKMKVPPKPQAKDTQEAAAQTLKRLFNRGS